MEEEEDDMHMCLVCHRTIAGLLNYVNHKKSECSGRKKVLQQQQQQGPVFPNVNNEADLRNPAFGLGSSASYISQSYPAANGQQVFSSGDSFHRAEGSVHDSAHILNAQTGLTSTLDEFDASQFQGSGPDSDAHLQDNFLKGYSLPTSQTAAGTNTLYDSPAAISNQQSSCDLAAFGLSSGIFTSASGSLSKTSDTTESHENHGLMNACIGKALDADFDNAVSIHIPNTFTILSSDKSPNPNGTLININDIIPDSHRKTRATNKAASEKVDDFFQSLELMSKANPKTEKGANFSQPLLPISNILSNLTFSSDEEDLGFNFADDVSLDSMSDESDDNMAPPSDYTGAKWKPGEKPEPNSYKKNRPVFRGKWPPGQVPEQTTAKYYGASRPKGGKNIASLLASRPKRKQGRTPAVSRQKVGRPSADAKTFHCNVCDISFQCRYKYSNHCGTVSHKERVFGKRDYIYTTYQKEQQAKTVIHLVKDENDEFVSKDIVEESVAKAVSKPAVVAEEESREDEADCDEMVEDLPGETLDESANSEKVGDTVARVQESEDREASQFFSAVPLQINVCTVCDKKFPNKYYISNHMLTKYHHNRSKAQKDIAFKLLETYHKYIVRLSPYQCTICRFYFNKAKYLEAHLNTDEHKANCEDLVGEITCSLCQYKTYSNDSILEHIHDPVHAKNCSNRKRVCIIKESHCRCKCRYCGLVFRSYTRLKRHTQRKHADGQIMETPTIRKVGVVNRPECPDCNKKFQSESGLQIHRRRKHTKDRPHQCKVCGVGFASKYDLKQHNKSTKHIQRVVDIQTMKIGSRGEQKGDVVGTKEDGPNAKRNMTKEVDSSVVVSDEDLTESAADSFKSSTETKKTTANSFNPKPSADSAKSTRSVTSTTDEDLAETIAREFTLKKQTQSSSVAEAEGRKEMTVVIKTEPTCSEIEGEATDPAIDDDGDDDGAIDDHNDGDGDYMQVDTDDVEEIDSAEEEWTPTTKKPGRKPSRKRKSVNEVKKVKKIKEVHENENEEKQIIRKKRTRRKNKPRRERPAKIFKCDHCQFTANSYNDLRPHYLAEHSGQIRTCELCDMIFLSDKAYNLHVLSNDHQKNITRTGGSETETYYTCHICKKKFTDEKYCNFHTAYQHFHHTTEESLLAENNGKCITRKTYAEYLETVKDLDKTDSVECPECKTSLKKGNLIEHLRMHTEDQPFKCKMCPKTYISTWTLRRHLLGHFGCMERTCEECGKHFKKLPSYEEHMKMHLLQKAGGKLHTCEVCGQAFYFERQLITHLRRHKSKEYACEVPGCHWKFLVSSELKYHMLSHTDHKPFLCDICGYATVSTSRLKRHHRTHTGERKYHCEYCTYRAGNSTHLHRHMRIHIGSKPFKCPYCEYSCNTHENMRKHIVQTKKHEGKPIYPCRFCEYGSSCSKEFRAHLVKTHQAEVGDKIGALSRFTGLYDKSQDPKLPEEGNMIYQVKERVNRDPATKKSKKKKSGKDKQVDTPVNINTKDGDITTIIVTQNADYSPPKRNVKSSVKNESGPIQWPHVSDQEPSPRKPVSTFSDDAMLRNHSSTAQSFFRPPPNQITLHNLEQVPQNLSTNQLVPLSQYKLVSDTHDLKSEFLPPDSSVSGLNLSQLQYPSSSTMDIKLAESASLKSQTGTASDMMYHNYCTKFERHRETDGARNLVIDMNFSNAH